MDVLKRGWIGLALFLGALILMPILVFGYDKGDNGEDSPPTSSLRPVPVAAAAPPPAPLPTVPSPTPTGPGLVFTGIREGDTISGFRQMRVLSDRYTGSILYILNGPIPVYTGTADSAPYLFAPQPGGWQTSQAPNGAYTLTAVPTEAASEAVSVKFTVSNYVAPMR